MYYLSPCGLIFAHATAQPDTQNSFSLLLRRSQRENWDDILNRVAGKDARQGTKASVSEISVVVLDIRPILLIACSNLSAFFSMDLSLSRDTEQIKHKCCRTCCGNYNYFIIFPTQKHERVPFLIQANNVRAVSVAYSMNPGKSSAKAESE